MGKKFFSCRMCRGRALKRDVAITENDLSPSSVFDVLAWNGLRIKKWLMCCSVQPPSYGCTREVAKRQRSVRVNSSFLSA